MTEERCFNLVDEAWIPVAGAGRASLREVFSRRWPGVPGGTPLEKIALFKLLQAIAQAAHTPAEEAEWLALGPDGLAEACLAYLERWHEAFWLYGPQAFLQFPAVKRGKIVPYGSLMPHIASGNTSVLFQSQVERPLDDGQKALLLLVNMSCCFSGKKVDKTVALSPGMEKSSSAKAGPAICAQGLLHSFVLGPTLRETVWRNLLTREELAEERLYENGVGTPPWERMPQGEADEVAEALKRSLMGRLVPLARFYLLAADGVHSVEGIQHPDYLQGGMVDPSVTGDRSQKKPKMLWADPQRRPWRMLPALLSFLRPDSTQDMRCLQLDWCLPRLKRAGQAAPDALKEVAIWSGGIHLSSNAGEQYLSGSDDVVESEISLPLAELDQEWFLNLRTVMEQVEKLGNHIYAAVAGYYREEKAESGTQWAERATREFWQLAERHFPALLEACGHEEPDGRDEVIGALRGCVLGCYARACPRETARQLAIWAKHRPFSPRKQTTGKG